MLFGNSRWEIIVCARIILRIIGGRGRFWWGEERREKVILAHKHPPPPSPRLTYSKIGVPLYWCRLYDRKWHSEIASELLISLMGKEEEQQEEEEEEEEEEETQ